MQDFRQCLLCEWRCGVNREAGERGVCRVGLPEIASTSFAPALQSYSITLLGCCYRCLHCNAYRISQYPDPRWYYRGFVDPATLADEALSRIRTFEDFPVDRIGFTGGDPIIHLPYIEQFAAAVRERGVEIGIGIATGGFATEPSMERLRRIATHITLEIKAYSDETHRALTGAPVAPVIRNAAYLARTARRKIRAFRTVVIPGTTETEVIEIAAYIASLDPDIPYRLVGFRPNFALYYHPGPSRELMERLAQRCREAGLTDVAWSGYYPRTVDERIRRRADAVTPLYRDNHGAGLLAAYAAEAGCPTHPRNCGDCPIANRCPATLKEPWNRR
jgi:pyruvate formate lyase activating enzyme